MADKLSSRSKMARRKPASENISASGSSGHPELGLALAGGGPLGVTYEIGALNALAESLEGINFAGLGVYVGVTLVPGFHTRTVPAAPVVRELEAAIASLEAWLRPHPERPAF